VGEKVGVRSRSHSFFWDKGLVFREEMAVRRAKRYGGLGEGGGSERGERIGRGVDKSETGKETEGGQEETGVGDRYGRGVDEDKSTEEGRGKGGEQDREKQWKDLDEEYHS
jgi:hypothetical protein